jgi:transposase
MGRWPTWRRERVWELWAQGNSIHAIAREVGMFRTSVTKCLNATGGVRPGPRRRAEPCLAAVEREEISRGLARGESFRAIASRIGRPHTSVAREVNRNGGRRRYRAQAADAAAWQRARRPKPSKLALYAPLRAMVTEKLKRNWVPGADLPMAAPHLP